MIKSPNYTRHNIRNCLDLVMLFVVSLQCYYYYYNLYPAGLSLVNGTFSSSRSPEDIFWRT